MRKITLAIVATVLIGGLAFGKIIGGIRGSVLSESSARAKWGAEEFVQDRFKTGSMEVRAKMAASLISQKSKYLGINRSEIRKVLGDYSGYYISSMYPTYLIQESPSDANPEAWQIVFLIDNNGKIRDIVIHKNCCD